MPGQLQLARAIPSRPGSPVGPEHCEHAKYLAWPWIKRNRWVWEGIRICRKWQKRRILQAAMHLRYCLPTLGFEILHFQNHNIRQTYSFWNVQESWSQFLAERNDKYHRNKYASHGRSIQSYKRPCIWSIICLHSSLKYTFSTKSIYASSYGRHTIYGMSKNIEVSS